MEDLLSLEWIVSVLFWYMNIADLYAWTLKVLPLAVLRSFSSVSGLARRRTVKWLAGKDDNKNDGWYLGESRQSFFAFSSGCMPLRP